MNEKNTQALFRDFHDLYCELLGDPLSLMDFGIECGDGWYEIIRDLSEKLASQYPDVRALWVTAGGDGGLEYYACFGPAEAYKLIDETQKKSFHVCERCGSQEDVGQFIIMMADRENKVLTRCTKCIRKEARGRSFLQIISGGCSRTSSLSTWTKRPHMKSSRQRPSMQSTHWKAR